MLAVCVRLRAAATALAAEQGPAITPARNADAAAAPPGAHRPGTHRPRPLNYPAAALQILGSLKHAGVVAEITGRQSFQAFGIMGG
jgi:hypothetical protein